METEETSSATLGTPDAIRGAQDEFGYVQGTVSVSLHDIIHYDLEGFLDLISELLVDSPLLMDVSYRVVGHSGDDLILEVTGDPSLVLQSASLDEPEADHE